MVSSCCICKLTQGVVPDVSFHSIPKNEIERQKWCNTIGRKITKRSLVCSKHFKENDFHYKVIGDTVRRFLLPGTIPSLLLIHHCDSIPENETSRANEIENIEGEVSKQSVICSKHFEEKYIYYKQSVRRFLVATAVPSLLNTNDSDNCIQPSTSHNAQFNAETVSNKSTLEKIEKVMDITSNSLCISDTSSYNNSKNIENMTNVEVIASDEIQFYKETDKDTKKLASKRNISQSFTSSKRFCNIRYIGDLQRTDFTSDRSWQIVQDYVHNSRCKHRILKQKTKRLSEKVKYLQLLLAHLKKNQKFVIH